MNIYRRFQSDASTDTDLKMSTLQIPLQQVFGRTKRKEHSFWLKLTLNTYESEIKHKVNFFCMQKFPTSSMKYNSLLTVRFKISSVCFLGLYVYKIYATQNCLWTETFSTIRKNEMTRAVCLCIIEPKLNLFNISENSLNPSRRFILAFSYCPFSPAEYVALR